MDNCSSLKRKAQEDVLLSGKRFFQSNTEVNSSDHLRCKQENANNTFSVKLQDSQNTIKVESLETSKTIFKGVFKGKPVALKKVNNDSIVSAINKKKWGRLKNENIVVYQQCVTQGSIR